MSNCKSVFYNGVEYASMRDLANALNVKYSTLMSRLDRGSTLEEAINKLKGYVYKGVTYPSLVALSKVSVVSLQCFGVRLRSGWDVTKAVETPLNPGNRFVFRGVEYNSVQSFADAFGIKLETVNSRLRSG